MARSKSTSRVPLKPVVCAFLALLGGVVLLVLSQWVKPPADSASAEATATTAPATAPASTPDGTPDDDDRARSQKRAAQNLSGLFLLFSAAGFLLCAICIGWLVMEVRKARPAWQKQHKYPQMRKK